MTFLEPAAIFLGGVPPLSGDLKAGFDTPTGGMTISTMFFVASSHPGDSPKGVKSEDEEDRWRGWAWCCHFVWAVTSSTRLVGFFGVDLYHPVL